LIHIPVIVLYEAMLLELDRRLSLCDFRVMIQLRLNQMTII